MTKMRQFLKISSLLTLTVFFISNTVWGEVSLGLHIEPRRETPSFLQVEIPRDLADVEEIYEAPPKVNPELLIHVQNAHGNYEAQLKIKQLMKYLYETYGFTLFFVEGAVEKLDPDYLRLFPEAKQNVELADHLAKEGKITGAEFFLIDAPPEVEAVGMEQAALYRANYDAFQEVYAAQPYTESFLDTLDRSASKHASRVFPPELRRSHREWQKFEKGHRDFLPYVKKLAQDARRVLGIDMQDLFSQVEWPQITRLLLLQSMESDLDFEAGRREKTEIVNWVRRNNLSPELVEALDQVEERNIRMSRLEPEDKRLENLPRYLLERLVLEGGPKGFRFGDYPAFSLYAGYFILKSEIDSRILYQEIELLFERILDRLAVSPEEKKLLTFIRDRELLKKLFSLELTRDEWDEFVGRERWLNPEAMGERLGRLTGEHSARNQIPSEVAGAYQAARKFYQIARQRETVFYYTIKQEMFKRTENKSTLLTGGFHTSGVFEMFRKDEVNYGILMPKIRGDLSRDNYLKVMLGPQTASVEAATMEIPAMMQNLSAVNIRPETDVMRDTFEAALQANLAGNWFRPADFVRVVNDSPAARQPTRPFRLFLNTEGNLAHVFLRDRFLTRTVMEKGQEVIEYLALETDAGKQNFQRTVWTRISPAGYDTDAFRRFVATLPPASAATLPATVIPVVDDTPASGPTLIERMLRYRAHILDAFPRRSEPLTLGPHLLDLLGGVNIEEALRIAATQEDRRKVAELVLTLVASGIFPDEDTISLSRQVALYGAILDLAGQKPSVLDELRRTNSDITSERPGDVVILRARPLSEEEIHGIVALLALNPRLSIRPVFVAASDDEAQALKDSAQGSESQVRAELSKLGVDVQDRFETAVVVGDGDGLRRTISSIYNKNIRPRLAATSNNAFVIFAQDGLRTSLGYIALPATVVESDLLQDDRNAPTQNFVGALLAQYLGYQLDQSFPFMEALALKEHDVASLNQMEYRVMEGRLRGSLQQRITVLIHAVQAIAQAA